MSLIDPTIGKDREDTSLQTQCWVSEDVLSVTEMVVDINPPEGHRYIDKKRIDEYVRIVALDYSAEEREGLLSELKSQIK